MPKDLSKTSDGSYKTTCQEELKKLANTLLIGTNGQDARELVSRHSSTYVSNGQAEGAFRLGNCVLYSRQKVGH